MYRVSKRDGVQVDFNVAKISAAIEKAFIACNKQYHPSVIDMLALRVTSDFEGKIKNDLVRCKNSFREMFMKDYMLWILYESQGSPRLNKVARNILFTYVPFSKEKRDNLRINPMYKDIIERYEVKQGAKIHRINNLIKKLNNNGKEITDEIMLQQRFLNS